MRELYINSELCDIDDDYSPTVQFRSFLFAKMQGYEAPRTWETSIPLTARNRAIIAQSQAADNTSSFPYATHTVSFYSDGYPIVENGRAYMVGTQGGRALFVFVLGETLPVLKSLSEVKLRELTETPGDYFAWNPSMNFNDMSSGFGWCNFFSFTNQDRTLTGTNSDLPYSTLHLTVTLNYVMNKIQAFFGLTFVGFGTLLNGCAFPLRDFEGISENIITTTTTGSDPEGSGISGVVARVPFSTFSSNFFSLIAESILYTDSQVDTALSITFSCEFLKDALGLAPSAIAVCVTDRENNETIISLLPTIDLGTKVRASTTGFLYTFTKEKRSLYFRPIGNPGNFSKSDLSISGSVTQAYYSNVSPGGFFPVIPNLPDMTCADFINQCCMLTGLFPYVDPATPTTINFYSAKVLYDNMPAANDWSKYIVKSTATMGEAEDMTHQLDGYAQNNRMLYADDPTNLLNTSGNLTVANTNIELEAELFKLTFAAGKRASSTNTIIDYPLYDVSVVDGALVRNPINQSQNIIGYIENVDSVNYLKFPNSLKFSQLQGSTAYLYYGAVINRPHLLREKFTLTARLVSLIDVRIPIYLEQYGKYYAIMEAQVDGEYNADVTLLEI